jgi:putative hydrolase of the HAD superfamily
VYPDTLPALESLRRHGYSLGVLTDVPYGMPKRFIEEDLARADLLRLFDYVLTSTEAGRRKPHPGGLLQLAAHFMAACDEAGGKLQSLEWTTHCPKPRRTEQVLGVQ